jgi:hypothetical protein
LSFIPQTLTFSAAILMVEYFAVEFGLILASKNGNLPLKHLFKKKKL